MIKILKVSEATHSRLTKGMSWGETMDDAINRLLDLADKQPQSKKHGKEALLIL